MSKSLILVLVILSGLIVSESIAVPQNSVKITQRGVNSQTGALTFDVEETYFVAVNCNEGAAKRLTRILGKGVPYDVAMVMKANAESGR